MGGDGNGEKVHGYHGGDVDTVLSVDEVHEAAGAISQRPSREALRGL